CRRCCVPVSVRARWLRSWSCSGLLSRPLALSLSCSKVGYGKWIRSVVRACVRPRVLQSCRSCSPAVGERIHSPSPTPHANRTVVIILHTSPSLTIQRKCTENKNNNPSAILPQVGTCPPC
uniref:Uncharacterized protein n=1 Tax=Anopheles quadriannulatus TaxID=34691 RepID=A0A182XRW7_ANOQN